MYSVNIIMGTVLNVDQGNIINIKTMIVPNVGDDIFTNKFGKLTVQAKIIDYSLNEEGSAETLVHCFCY